MREMKLLVCKILEKQIKKYIEVTGDDYNEICNKYRKLMTYSPLGFIPFIILSLFFKQFILSAIGYFLLIYFYPFLYTWSRSKEYKKLVNTEAPIISLIAYINSLVDKSIIYTLEELSKIKELKTPKIELEQIKKSISVLNMSSYKAIEKRATVHHDDLLGVIYSKYVLSSEIGLSIRERLKEAMSEIFQRFKDQYKGYVDKAVEIAEMEFAIFLMVPIILIGFQFTFKTNIFELVLPLLFTPAFVFLITTIQPDNDYSISFDWRVFLPLIVIPIVIFANILLAFKLVIISIIVSFVVYWIYRQIRLANELISILPTLLKEISDYMRLGYNIKFSFKKVDVNASSRVQRILEEISKEFTVKNEVTEVKTPSKLFNIIIQILSLFEKSGISYEAMDELSSLVNDLLGVRLSLIRQLRLFDLMVILTPIMLWLTFSMMGNISGSNNVTLFSVVLFSYSLASSVIFSKLSRFTIFYLPTILSGIIMALILSFLPHVIFI